MSLSETYDLEYFRIINRGVNSSIFLLILPKIIRFHLNKIWKYAGKEVWGGKIAVFRILFAIVLFFQAWHFYSIDFIKRDVIDPVLHFSYPYLPFIESLNPYIMYGMLVLMFISSVLIVLGIKSRLFFTFYFIAFTYLFLIDKGYYNNHYYLLSLLLFLMIFIKSDTQLAVLPCKQKINYAWEVYILIFQFSLVLIIAGLNKLNPWWLIHHEPIHHILEAKVKWSGNLFWSSMLVENVLVWGGVLFDLLIIPLLVWKRSRIIAVFLFFFFNGMNYIVFQSIGEIGIFPLLMLSSLILFFPNQSIINAIRKINKQYKVAKVERKDKQFSTLLKGGLIVYVLLQLTIPIRHHFFTGNVDYTGEGQRFSWRMKSVYKDFSIAFILKDEEKGISASLDPRTVLTEKQYTNLGYYPELIIPVAENLKNAAKEKGVRSPRIYVDYKVGFMALPMQYIVDPGTDILTLNYSPFRHSSWILPLEQD